jgi:hypothetical protein
MRSSRRIVAFAVFAALVSAPATMAQQRKARPPKSVRLYVIDCGSLDIPDTSPYRLKKEDLATSMMSAPCFLVAHPRGTLMWDTGPVPDTNFKPDGGSATMRYATSTKPLTARLAEMVMPRPTSRIWRSRIFTGTTWAIRTSSRAQHGLCQRPNGTLCSPIRLRRVRSRRISAHSGTAKLYI